MQDAEYRRIMDAMPGAEEYRRRVTEREVTGDPTQMMEALVDILVYGDKCLDGGRHHALERIKSMAAVGLMPERQR
jgi:hypothetical protein